MSRDRGRYSDEDIASALAMLEKNGGNISMTARELEIPPSSLRSWRDGTRKYEAVTDIRDRKKLSLAEKFEQVAHAYLDRALEDSALMKTGGQSAVIAAATALDKLRLLRGEPTDISLALSDEQRKARLDELYELARKRKEAAQHEIN